MEYSKTIPCGHCTNISKMEIIGNVKDTIIEEIDPEYGPSVESGTFYEVLKCPACSRVNIVSYGWHEYMESDEEFTYELLYPQKSNFPIGLPDNILKTLKAAEKIKTIDVNAYAILMRRLLELVCIDRKAKGANLALMLKDLSNKNEIPVKLVDVAKGLKDFGNIGAHAGIGELSEKEIPIVRALSYAILEYIYTAPYLATLAESKLDKIKSKGKRKPLDLPM